MTHRSPLDGTTLSRGQTNYSNAQLTFVRKHIARLAQPLGLALLLGTLAGCDPANQAKQVELVMGTPEPTPGATFELRFDSPMIPADHVGLTATNSPLIIEPNLSGTFTWLSVRSGVFTPAEPLALDQTYMLTLQPGLQGVDGRRCDATLHWTVTTPQFDMVASSPQQIDSNAYSMPETKLTFNADVRAADLRGMLYFRDRSGRRVPADVRQGTLEDYWAANVYDFNELQTWKQQAAAVGRFRAPHESRVSENPTNELPNLLIASPRDALPIGDGWRLVVPDGVISADHLLVSRGKHEVPIGNVTPFVVRDVGVDNVVNSGASVWVDFSKAIPDSLTNTFRDWVEVSPAVTNLSAGVEGRRLVLAGDFRGGAEYSLILKAGFPSDEAFTLGASNIFTEDMPHVPPRLYFPALSRDQMASGKRSFPLLTINVSHVHVRAKLMDAHTAIHALRGFRSYFASEHEPENNNWNEPYRALDYNVLPGTTVFDDKLNLGASAADSDKATNLDLDWDKLLNGRHAGVALLDARRVDDDNRDPILGAQTLIQLTDLGMVWKNSPQGVDVFVFSQSTGQPVGGATARLFGNENEALEEAVTDTIGLAHLEAKTNADWIAVERGDDFHALPLDANRVWMYGFHLPYAGNGEREDSRRVMLFSDRDLYRPGEAMHFEAIVRDWAGTNLSVPVGVTGMVECVDPRGTHFFRTNVTLGSLGSWSTLVPLPATPAGYYEVKLHLGTNEYMHSFQVQDFQPNAFEITLPCKDAYSVGEPIALPLSARYLFGKSLSHAQIAWSLNASDMDFKPVHFHQFNFQCDDIESRFGRGRPSVSLSGHVVLTAGTNCVITPDVPLNPAAPQPRFVSLLAEVTDINQQTLSHSVEFIRHSSDFYLGLRQGADVLTNGTNIPLEVVAVGADGKPWSAPVEAHLSLQRVDWQNVRVQGSGMTARFHNEPVITNILEREISVKPIAVPESSDEEVRGNTITDLPSLPPGEYLVEVKAEDVTKHPIASSLDFQVAAPAEMGRNFRNDVELTLKADHKSYAAGQTAEILVEAPFSGTALVSVEREKVLRSFVTHLEGNAPSVRVPLEPGDVPNVFVSVTLTRGAADSPHKVKEPEYRIGCCELPVTNAQNLLGVEITSSQADYLPGRPVEVGVRVTDFAQQPVSGAETILYAVDDGILGLSDYKLPDPYNFFYATRPLCVQSSVSLPNLLPEDPGDLQFENKGYLGGGGGFDRVRKNFLACAFWNATLITDTDGRVHARFTAPDSLTRYRLFAVVHTADNHFGSGQSAFRVSKPLIVQPSLPSIANITDHLIARAVVLNQTKNAGAVIVTLELDDKASGNNSETNLTQTITIPANGSVPVEFPVKLVETGDAKWIWKARFADGSITDFSDAVESTLAVGHIAPVIRDVLLTRATTTETNLLAFANPQLLGGRGTITVNLANTRLNELNETASQLLHYPYGCAEQTGSSLLPWILLRDAPGLLPLHWAGTNDEEAAIRSGIERLFSMQTESGGLAYWPHEKDPMLWASAYGGMVLALAERHGSMLPKEKFDQLLKFLSEQLRSPDDDAALSDDCLAAYALALAGRAEPAYHEKLYSLRAKLRSEDQALLALAIAEAHGPAEMIHDLLQTNSTARWDYEGRFDCGAREDAVRLLAWISYRPEDSSVDKLVDDLMRDQKNAHWETTQGNAWGLLALTEYARRVEIKRRPADGQLSYDGQSIPFHVDDQTNVFSHSFAIANIADVPLLLAQLSTNRLYASVTIEGRPPELPQPRQDRGFGIERTYDRLDNDDRLGGTNEWQVGDRVLVTIHVHVHDTAKYMVIDDPLPATLEAINPEFRTQQARSSSALADDATWWMSDFHEIRKDRCLSFANYVEPGDYTFRYLARVRAAGTVTAPPAKVEEMYHPERCGFTESQVLMSKGFE
ncbi:MAG TPA: alpha-2-macroglobulin family protein [Verrucomicrobiae bacterium]|nr:alpha-2-macroglobulin family protein [Verrucomicrobiae bacterium]